MSPSLSSTRSAHAGLARGRPRPRRARPGASTSTPRRPGPRRAAPRRAACRPRRRRRTPSPLSGHGYPAATIGATISVSVRIAAANSRSSSGCAAKCAHTDVPCARGERRLARAQRARHAGPRLLRRRPVEVEHPRRAASAGRRRAAGAADARQPPAPAAVEPHDAVDGGDAQQAVQRVGVEAEPRGELAATSPARRRARRARACSASAAEHPRASMKPDDSRQSAACDGQQRACGRRMSAACSARPASAAGRGRERAAASAGITRTRTRPPSTPAATLAACRRPP